MSVARVCTPDAVTDMAIDLTDTAAALDSRATVDRPSSSRAAAGNTRAKIDTVGRAWIPHTGTTADRTRAKIDRVGRAW
jgi:hypothetical protein